MTVLPDVNVLIALAWPNHPHHNPAHSWFDEHGKPDWATCAITESGFLRISCNPSAVRYTVTLAEAIALLGELRGIGVHHYWPLDRPIVELPSGLTARVQGYRRVSDAVLLATAMQHNGQLATFDRSLASLVSVQERRFLHVIQA